MILLMEDEAVEIAKSILGRCLSDEDFRELNYGAQVMVLGTAISLLGMEYLTKENRERK